MEFSSQKPLLPSPKAGFPSPTPTQPRILGPRSHSTCITGCFFVLAPTFLSVPAVYQEDVFLDTKRIKYNRKDEHLGSATRCPLWIGNNRPFVVIRFQTGSAKTPEK